MKIRIRHQFWIIFFAVILISLFACQAKVKNGTIKEIEVDRIQVENDPPQKTGMAGAFGERYSSWEEAYASGWKSDIFGFGNKNRYRTESKPTGFVIVLLEDGTKVRCKNPFPDVSWNKKVKVKETATGDWVLTQ